MNFKIRGENMSVTSHLREYAEKRTLKFEWRQQLLLPVMKGEGLQCSLKNGNYLSKA